MKRDIIIAEEKPDYIDMKDIVHGKLYIWENYLVMLSEGSHVIMFRTNGHETYVYTLDHVKSWRVRLAPPGTKIVLTQ